MISYTCHGRIRDYAIRMQIIATIARGYFQQSHRSTLALAPRNA